MPSRILAALRKPKRIATSLPELRYLVFEGMKGETGDSAYEEAVQLGFEGTEEEWLASLKGDTGANGRDGQDGAPGTPGADGEDGVSPTVQTAAITGGHRVTITDKAHPQGQSFDVMNGANGTVPAYLDRTAGVVRLVKGDAVYTSEMMQSDLDDGVPPLITAYGESGEEFFELDTRLVSASPTVGFRSKEHLLTVDSTGAYTLTDRPQGGGSSDAVLYTEQSLTPAQKEQARGNIGAVWSADFDSVTSIVPSRNLFNPSEFQHGGGYISADGVVHANETYGYTGFIPVSEGDTLWWNGRSARTICAYNAEKRAVAASGSNVKAESGEYTVPSGISFVRITFWEAYVPEHPMINVGAELLDYEPYGSKRMVKLDAIPTIPKDHVSGFPFEQTESLLGSDSPTVSAATLASGTALTLTDAPYFIKKNVTVSARMEFETFTSVEIGKGQNSYRGKSVVVDGTNITQVSYNDSGTAVSGSVVAHGLTISDYLQVTMFMGDDGKCEVTINTTSGTFNTIFDFSAEWNYSPFVVGAQAMTDVQLGYSCSDIRCPMWIFGDSYLGLWDNRVGGQLKQLGFFNVALIGVAGGRANDGSKATYPDLQRMLTLGTPKYIVWALGMNGGDNVNIAFLPTLIKLCEDKDIKLILYKVPHIPTIDHSTLNAYIESTGLRYIDACAAVGATTAGVWYTGMLSSDEVHPSALGAKAIAMRFLMDVPEIIQYGKSEEYATEAWVQNRGYQTATQVQTAISGVRQLPAVTASDNGKFLRVVSGAWAAETVQTWQGGSY